MALIAPLSLPTISVGVPRGAAMPYQAPIGHVDDIDAGHHLEQFAGDVQR